MKKSIRQIIVACLYIGLISCLGAETDNNGFTNAEADKGGRERTCDVTINGLVKNHEGITKVWFKKQFLPDNKYDILDSAVIDNKQNFRFHFPSLSPGYYQILCRSEMYGTSRPVFSDSGIYTLQFLFDTSSFATNEGRIKISKCEISGSPDNYLLDEHSKIAKHYYTDLITPTEDRIRGLINNNDESSKALLDSLNSAAKKYRKASTSELNEYVLNRMGSSIAVYQTMSSWDNADFSFMQTIMERFRTMKSNSFILPVMESKYRQLLASSLLNNKAPLFALKDSNGRQVNLSGYIGKKKILIDFWASWCGPCIREMIAYRESYNKIKDQDIIIISISTDKNQGA